MFRNRQAQAPRPSATVVTWSPATTEPTPTVDFLSFQSEPVVTVDPWSSDRDRLVRNNIVS
jgi:hypothetical protein